MDDDEAVGGSRRADVSRWVVDLGLGPYRPPKRAHEIVGSFSPVPLAAVANEDPALSAGTNKVVMWSFPIVNDGLV